MKKCTIKAFSAALAAILSFQTAPFDCGIAADSVRNFTVLEAEKVTNPRVSSSASKVLTGDVNSDGELDDDDINAFDDEDAVAKMPPQADVNADGVINSDDADIIRSVLWNDSYFPVGKYYNKDAKFVTRAEFVHEVASAIGFDPSTVKEKSYYDDLEGCSYADEITSLSALGAINTYDSEFYPDKPADRDFVTYTLDWALGIDSDDKWKNAIDLGWFKKDNDEFHERLYVTEAEYKNILSILKTAPILIRGDQKLTSDLTVEKDMLILRNLDLNGHKLILKNGLTIRDEGSLSFNKGSVLIDGDLNAEYSRIEMTNKSDYLCVNGKADLSEVYGDHFAGTMEFKGDLKAIGLNTRDSHKILFSGSTDQQADLREAELANVEVRYSDKRELVVNMLRIGGTLSGDGDSLNITAACDDDSTVFEINKFSAKTVNITGSITGRLGEASGININIDGNFNNNESTDADKSVITVKGSCVIDGNFELNSGVLDVREDFNGAGIIRMNDSNGKLIVGGKAAFDNAYDIDEGEIVFKGDVSLKNTEFGSGIISTLAGAEDVSVQMDTRSDLSSLTVENAGRRKLTAEGAFRASQVDCGSDKLSILSYGADLSFGTLKTPALSIEGDCSFFSRTSTKAQTIDISGSATINGELSLDGTVMTVTGDLITSERDYSANCLTLIGAAVSAKEMSIRSGIDISQSTVKTSKITVNAQNGNDAFNFRDKNSSVETTGDMVIDTGVVQGEGMLICGGDLSFGKNTCLKNTSIVFSGNSDSRFDTNSKVHASSVTVKDPSKNVLTVSGELLCDSLKAGSGKLNMIGDKLIIVQTLLDSDAAIKGDVVIADSDDYKAESLSLNGHSLSIDGDIIHSGGTLNIDNGKLSITGDYMALSNYDSAVKRPSDGFIKMENENDYMLVEGNFLTIAKKTSPMTAGVLEIKGDLTQKADGSAAAFAPSGTHTTILSGEKKQTISFESYGESFLNYIVMTQNPEQYDFKNGQCWKFPGDVNEDGSVDLKDVVMMREAIAGWDNKIVLKNADVNGDSSFDMKDLIILRRFLAGGWDITLK
ncbi:MAG: hypothetical protein IKO47_10435 [Ruminococcus sp.]|nr:hypothetical protein [Ruminococcus sp.]